MMSSRALRRAAALPLLAVAAACTAPAAAPPGDGFAPIACVEPGVYDLGPLAADEGVDALELRTRSAPDDGAPPGVAARGGVPCARAADPAACAARFDAATSDAGFVLGGSPDPFPPYAFLVVDQGDDVRVVASAGDLVAFLGRIDSPAKAWLLVLLSQAALACDDASRGGVRAVDDGFEVIATAVTHDCVPLEISRFYLHVAPDGTIHTERSEVAQSIPDACS